MEHHLQILSSRQQAIDENYVNTSEVVQQMCQQALLSLKALHAEKVLLFYSSKSEHLVFISRLAWSQQRSRPGNACWRCLASLACTTS